MPEMPWRFLRAFSQRSLSKKADVTVEGAAFVPSQGPVILAARHVHHQMDGEVLLATIPRPTHLVVAIDWASNRVGRAILVQACRWARWPTVIRNDSPFSTEQSERRRQNYRAMKATLALLREGRLVVIFPEGFPNIDNNPTPKRTANEMLPFQAGVAKLAHLAQSSGIPVQVIPVGFVYEPGTRWHVTVRFGPAITVGTEHDRVTLQTVEREVERLSTAGTIPKR